MYNLSASTDVTNPYQMYNEFAEEEKKEEKKSRSAEQLKFNLKLNL